MGKITLITGGTASGKSRWAISHFAECNDVLYLCAAPHLDGEAAERIRYSNHANGVKWNIEEGCRLRSLQTPEHKYIIYDSLARYTADMINALGRSCPDLAAEKERLKKSVAEDVERFLDKVNSVNANLILITNETGFSIIPPGDNQRCYREILGFVNQRTANMATEVYMSVSGIQMKIK